jgi:hypothetical protein
MLTFVNDPNHVKKIMEIMQKKTKEIGKITIA